MPTHLPKTLPGPQTFFAPPDRDDLESVRVLAARIDRHADLLAVLESIPGLGVILNPQRQIVAANQRMLANVGASHRDQVLGLRLGESIGCARAHEAPAGCGTGSACALCGAGTAIHESQCERRQVTKECRISIDSVRFEAMDFEVVATPLAFENTFLTVCALRDISGEKRRRILERVFFHDVLNTAGGLKGLAEILAEGHLLDPDGELEVKTMLAQVAQDHVLEIDDQRQLMAAESGELQTKADPFLALEMLKHVRASLANHTVAKNRTVRISETTREEVVEADANLVRRILVNMAKNALEAVEENETVTLGCSRANSHVRFSVHNPGFIPSEVQLQIFNRSFSTKSDRGRGIGTYSMKLLGETYLKGKVGFDSDAREGTTFWLQLPADS